MEAPESNDFDFAWAAAGPTAHLHEAIDEFFALTDDHGLPRKHAVAVLMTTVVLYCYRDQ